jgi:hypothetical protein
MIMNNLGLVEAALTFLIVVGFCVWQYVSISLSQAKDRAKAEAEKLSASGHAEGEHSLDDGRHEAVE